MNRVLVLAMLTAISTAGCASPDAFSRSDAPDFQASVKSEVEATVRDFFDGFRKASCTDGRPVSKHVRDPMMFVLKDDIYVIPRAEHEKGVRDLACTWQKHDGVVKTVIVEPLGPNAAVAAWTYRDDIVLKSGELRNSNGAVLMTLVKASSGWLITSTKTTETIEPKTSK